MRNNLPREQGLYDPRQEKDSCGVGFVSNINGARSHELVRKGIEVLERMSHRGAVGADPKTGDGAGILIQIPHEYYKDVCGAIGTALPDAGEYGTGIIFLPTETKEENACKEIVRRVVEEEGQKVLCWRTVPVDNAIIGVKARETSPSIQQVFIVQGAKSGALLPRMDFERKLYVIRRRLEKEICASSLKQKDFFYVTNISSRTVSYKGLLMPEQLEKFYVELKDKRIKSAIALVHSRYSTNTFPTWDLAQPFRFLAHNGEINTLRGNINWFKAKESLLASELFGKDIEKIKPVIVEDGSDSAIIDNVFELLSLAGRPLLHVMMLLIPAAWERDDSLPGGVRDFYEYNACFMEPWDGPAAIAFTDGSAIGAVLDRNGLRPARYIVTKDGFVVMSSEVGVLEIDPRDIAQSGRLEPGKIFYIDTVKKQIIGDQEIKKMVSSMEPYGEWNRKNIVYLDKISGAEKLPAKRNKQLLQEMKAFGYTREDLKFILKPMAEEGKEPIGSMGNDTPHAVLSERPELLYDYFKQLFAQVTNPAIDPIREEIVMSLDSFLGKVGNILDETPGHCHRLFVKAPVLSAEEMDAVRGIKANGFKSKTVSTLFDAHKENGMEEAVERVFVEAEKAKDEGCNFIILSDKGMTVDKAAIPALLAVSALHQFLVRKTTRSQVSIIVESGEPREVHHFALLLGFGADCVYPYLAYDVLEYIREEKLIEVDAEKALKNYKKALRDGLFKILSKMGISTLRSYRGAQIFEALGLDKNFIEKYFTGTVSRIGGADIKIIEKETVMRHEEAFGEKEHNAAFLNSGGKYQWKKDGEFHLWNPDSIAALQDSVRKNKFGIYKEFAALINDQSKHPTTLRSLLSLK
ncbi:MAG: glutamate synthase subunit alpha, partial [Candidatus Omnitrophica bacterium]|nr:glutamate synthase subunit alpha [Candidatus Omnitrophota bacterium]